MTVLETENSILSDLALLGGELERMEYILACAGEYPGIPEDGRSPLDLVADCQTNTWLRAVWLGDTLSLKADSESALVKGALSLITELYDGRTRAELRGYHCGLMACESLRTLFNNEQKKGLDSILRSLSEREGGV